MGEWKTGILASLGVIQTGSTPKTTVKENFGNAIPFVKPADFQSNGAIDYEKDGLSEKGLTESRLIKKNSVLMVCIGATIGKVGYTSIDVTTNQQINSITPHEGLLTKYCYYAMLNDEFKRKVIRNSSQATLPIINKSKWSSLELKYPREIEEQLRIVAILDQAFADIEKARANAEQNLKNARELFDSYLQQVFSQRGEGWVEQNLDQIVEENCSLSYGIVQPGDNFSDGLPVVRPTDLKSKIIHIKGLKLINPELASAYKRTTLEGGELLLCVRGSTGVISIASQELSGANVTRGIVPIRFDESIMMQTFGYYQFISEKIQSQIKEKTYGAALMQINIRDLRKLTFVIPPLSFQNGAIQQLDKVARKLERLGCVYQEKINSLDELKKSLLQKAFSGELTKSKGMAA